MFNLPNRPDPPRSKVILWAILASLALPTSPASATEFCDDLTTIVQNAGSNFTDTPALPTLLGAPKCTMSRALSAANAYHCAQEFSYRDPAANIQFNQLNQSVLSCFGDAVTAPKNQGVNHPDTFDQSQFRVGPVVITLSLKDKGALQQTYIFVGVQGAVLE